MPEGLENMDANRFLKSLVSMGVGSAVLNVCKIIVIIIVARPLSADELGGYFIIVALAGVFFSVSCFGTNVSLVKFVAEEQDEHKKKIIIFTSLNFFLIASVVILVLLLLINNFWVFVDIKPIHVMFVVSLSLFQYLTSALQAMNLFKIIALTNIISGLLYVTTAVFFLIILDMGLQGFFISVFIANLVPIAVQLYYLTKDMKISNIFEMDWLLLQQILKFSFPLYLNQLYTNLYDRGYTLLIALMLSPAAVAFYSIATRIPTAIEEIRKVYLAVFYPTMLEALAVDKKRASEFLSLSVYLFFISILMGSSVFLYLKEDIVILLFGEKYSEASVAAFVMVLRTALTFCGPILGLTIIALGHNKVPLAINIIVTSTTFLISYFLIPIYGYMAVVYVALLGSIMGFILNSLFLKKKYSFISLGRIGGISFAFLCFLSMYIYFPVSFGVVGLVLFLILSGYHLKDQVIGVRKMMVQQ